MYLSKYVGKRSHFFGSLNALRLNHASHSFSDEGSAGSFLRDNGYRSLARMLLLAVLSMLLPGVHNAFAQNSTIFGPNVYVFTPSDSASSINATLNTLNTNAEFSTNR